MEDFRNTYGYAKILRVYENRAGNKSPVRDSTTTINTLTNKTECNAQALNLARPRQL